MNGWYSVSKEEIHKYGGGGLLASYYKDSPSKALKTIYPDHNWISWNFKVIPMGFWKKQDNQREFLHWLGVQLGYEEHYH